MRKLASFGFVFLGCVVASSSTGCSAAGTGPGPGPGPVDGGTSSEGGSLVDTGVSSPDGGAGDSGQATDAPSNPLDARAEAGLADSGGSLPDRPFRATPGRAFVGVEIAPAIMQGRFPIELQFDGAPSRCTLRTMDNCTVSICSGAAVAYVPPSLGVITFTPGSGAAVTRMPPDYSGLPASSATFAPGTDITIAGLGGHDVGPFSFVRRMPALIQVIAPSQPAPATFAPFRRDQALTFEWNTVGVTGEVRVTVAQANGDENVEVNCRVSASLGGATIPVVAMSDFKPSGDAFGTECGARAPDAGVVCGGGMLCAPDNFCRTQCAGNPSVCPSGTSCGGGYCVGNAHAFILVRSADEATATVDQFQVTTSAAVTSAIGLAPVL